MYKLILTSLRHRADTPALVEQILRAQGTRAMRMALAQHEAGTQRIATGQLLGRLMLASGHLEDAEEVFQRLLRCYETLPKQLCRFYSTLDSAVMAQSLQRTGRAATHFNDVADDESTPAPLRIEALCGLAETLHSLGQHGRALLTAQEAQRIALCAGLDEQALVIKALETDLDMTSKLCEPGPGSELAVAARSLGRTILTLPELAERAEDMTAALAHLPPARERMTLLAALAKHRPGGGCQTLQVRGALDTLRHSQWHCLEDASRIDATTSLLQRGDMAAAQSLLGTALQDEGAARRHPLASDLLSCLSQMHSANGRHADALRLYREHAQLRLQRLHKELPQLPQSRFLERLMQTNLADNLEVKLPARYRKAYRFIMEHLKDVDLSIKDVASHVSVTERALQMAFRMHLGLSPAEVIRHQRLGRIRQELMNSDTADSAFTVATRWGVGSRSTFTHNYRQQFGELPSSTARRSY